MYRVIILIISIVSISFSQNRQTDSLALVSIYNSTNGDSWYQTWDLNTPMNTWYGVTISNNRVTQLNFYNRNMSDSLPSEIGDLSELTYLQLEYNRNLANTLPNEIGRLKKMNHLSVARMDLIALPDSIIQLSNLETLNAYDNDITELPDSIFNLTNLQYIYLSDNKIISISDDIQNLTSLNYLDLSSNLISTIPSGIEQLSALATLNLSDNFISSFSIDLSLLGNLNTLYLSNNNLTNLPADMSDLTSLLYFYLENNNFSTFPQGLLTIISLEGLHISNNNISSIPTNISNLSQLENLTIEDNSLSDLPFEFSSLTELYILNIRRNNFTSFPSVITSLSKLGSLRLDENKIEVLPNEIGRLTNLIDLYAYDIGLTGTLPDSLQRLTKLNTLALSTNKITEIPDWISSLTLLRILNLNNNLLTEFNPEIGNLLNLYDLNLQNNMISGVLPASIGNLEDLGYLRLSNNQIDSIPSYIGTSMDDQLYYLYMQNNNLGFSSFFNNENVGAYGNYFSNQDNYGHGLDTLMSLSQTITLNSKYDHPDNLIQWYKDSQAIDGETNTTLTLTLNNLDDAGRYFYRYTNPGSSYYIDSKDFNIGIPDSEAPPIVSYFNAEARNASAYLAWATNSEDVYDFAAYDIMNLDVDTIIISLEAGSNEYTVQNLTNDLAYNFGIRVRDNYGNISSVLSQTVTPDGVAPLTPQNLIAEAREEAVHLSWDAVENESYVRYRIYRGTSSENLTYFTYVTSTNYTNTNLSNGVNYYYKISAQDAAENESGLSNLVNAIPVNINPPKPLNLWVEENVNTITVRFDLEYIIPDFKHYILFMDTETDPVIPIDTLNSQENIGSNNLKFTVSNLVDDTEYFFRVKTVDETNLESDYSENVSGIPGNYRLTDSLALVAIYNAMDGTNWSNQSNWLVSEIQNWSGVTVTNDRVTRLDLNNRQLNGLIPPEIGALTGLTYLRMTDDEITDSIPSEIGNLKNLETLYLFNNKLTSIPKKIGNLTRLTNFRIYNNMISEVPDEIASLTNLTDFNIGTNNLSSFPNVLINMPKLVYLFLNNNYLTEFNHSFATGSNLNQIYLDNNLLNSFPANINTAEKLQYLYINNNQITSMDADFSGMDDLIEINITNNLITAIPATITNLTNIERFFISNNLLTSIPDEFFNLSKLNNINFDYNNLTSIPSSISNASSIVTLSVESNNLNTLPTELASLVDLENVYLDNNKFTEIPNVLFSMPKLGRLELQSNLITSFNTNMQNMTTLKVLYLNNNQIQDSIPSEIGYMSSLESLYLYNNQIFGKIPSSIENMSSLYYLNINDNNLNEPLDESLGRIPLIENIYLNNNNIPGNIPSSIGSATSLRSFEISNNKLTGTLNPDLANSTTIYTINIQNNMIDSIPDFSGTNLDNTIRYFYIRYNNLGFDDIINNISVPQYSYTYNEMNLYGDESIFQVTEGENLTLQVKAGHVDDQIQWQFNNNNITGATNPTLVLTNISTQETGTYRYILTNANAPGLTLTSSEINVLIPDSEAPQVPGNFTAAPRNMQAYLSWNSNNESDFKHFLLYNGSNDEIIDSLTTNNITFDSLINDTEYSYYLTAVDLWGNESQASQTLTVAPDGNPPATVTGLTAVAREQEVFLSWDALENEAGVSYRIYRGTGENNITYHTSTTNTSYSSNGLTNGTKYYFKILARDFALNDGSLSDFVTGIPENINPPEPIQVSTLDGKNKITVKFNIERQIPDFKHYVLFMGQSINPTIAIDTLTTQYSVNSNNLKFDIENLTNDENYYFRIKTIDQTDLESDYSEDAHGIPSDYRSSDSLALVAMYNALDGTNWNNQSNWLTESSISTWSGVQVNSDRVTYLDLYNRNLAGIIPAEIGDLTGLTYIRIGNDPVTDSIPSEIGKLKNLNNLNIFNTQISSIPKKIAGLKQLTNLDLSNNDILEIPAEIGSLTELRSMQLSGNEISQVPDELSELSKLNSLYLSNNPISNITVDFTNAVDLTRIDIINANLTEFPIIFANAPNLTQLFLNENFITSLSGDLSSFNKLSDLRLGSNQIQSIDPSIADITTLTRIFLYDNGLSSFPEELLSIPSLDEINLSSNNLTSLPTNLSNLTNLHTINLGSNQFTSIPDEIIELSNLEYLDMSSNQLTSIHSQIDTLKSLRFLYLSDNQITGPIQSNIGHLAELYDLRLNNNQLTGNIPSSFGNLKKLNRLRLFNNQLDEEFPAELVGMTSLYYLEMYNNKIPGNFPDNMHLMTSLGVVNLDNNILSGTINPSIAASTSINQLYLTNNLIDSVPDFSGSNLDNVLNYFNINNNKLDFNNIIKNLNVATYSYRYWDQKNFGEEKYLILNAGESAVLNAPTDHPANIYQWYFNGNSISDATSQTYQIDSVTAATAGIYTYRVTNPSAPNLTLRSNDLKVLVPDNVAPPIPASFSVIPRNGAALLSWNANNDPDFKHYLIYSSNVNKNGTLIDSTTNTTYTVENLNNEVDYSFYITSIDIWGNESSASSTKLVTPDGIAPTIPQNPLVEASENRASFSWDHVDDENQITYGIYYGTSEESLNFHTTTTNNYYNFSNLTNGTTYYFAVLAADIAENQSELSNIVSDTPINLAPPTPINLYTVEEFEKVTVNFNIEYTISDFKKYELYMGTEDNPTNLVDSLKNQYGVNSSSLKFVVDNLTNDQKYYFRLKTFDVTGLVSEFSESTYGIPGEYRSKDSLALVAVYNALNGPEWNNQTNWLSEEAINTWSGVSVSNNRVTNLDLYNRNLSGQIPPEIGNLSGLTYLRMAYDDVVDSIPSEIGNLKNLQSLQLHNMQLTSIPKTIGNLKRLQSINLYSNKFTSMPDEIGNLSNLDNLNIHSNQITAVPASFSNLTKIQTFGFSTNLITSFDIELSELENLITIDLNNNSITEFSDKYADAPNLQNIYLNNNNIAIIESDLSQLRSVRRLYLDNNNLSSLSETIADMLSLVTLTLRDNGLSQIPIDILSNSSLSELFLDNNNISTLNYDFSSLENLTSLNIRNNKLTEIPESILALTDLKTLNLSSNKIKSINSKIDTLRELQNLYLENNEINDSIPSSIGNLTSLINLYINNNSLKGGIPASFGNLKTMNRLRLYNNNLTGPLPDEITEMTSLRYLEIQSNQFQGELPSNLGALTHLDYLYIFDNNFTGSLDGNLANNTSLLRLYAENNNFDSIADFAGQAIDDNLQYIRIYNNHFGFESIIKNLNVASSSYQYSPQNKFGKKRTIISSIGESLNINADSDHEDNEYQWYFNNSLIEGATSSEFIIDTIKQAQSGIYSYRMTNSNVGGLTITSEDIILLVPDEVAPNKPLGFNAYPRNASVVLEWNANEENDLRRYDIYLESENGKRSFLDSTINNFYKINDLVNGEVYNVHIVAVDIWGNESQDSDIKSVSPDGTAPAIPNNVTANAFEASIELSWDAVEESDLLKYYVYISFDAGNSYSLHDSTFQNNILIEDLPNDLEYFLKISSKDNALNESAASNPVSATPINLTPPELVGIGVLETDEKLIFSWAKSQIQDFNNYEVFFDTIPESENSYQKIYNINTNNLELLDLVNGKNYYLSIRQTDDDGLSSIISSEILATPGNYFENDSLALIALYDSLGGDNWSNKSGWKTDTVPLTDWFGVDVSQGRVTSLILQSNNMSGRIPSELGTLTALVTLDFYNSRNIVGQIPEEIGNLKNIENLYLRRLGIEGPVPSTIGNLGKLINLYLYDNYFNDSIPVEIGNLSNLELLYLYNSRMIGEIPEELGRLKKLRQINLSTNQLTGEIPDSLSNLESLYYLYLYNNQLTGEIPSSLSKLKNVTRVYLYSNQLSGEIPIELANLPSLQYLNLSRNNLTGSVPSAFGNIQSLVSLNIQYNQLSGNLTPELGRLSNLNEYYANNNLFEGTIPEEYGNLAKLDYFYVQSNSLEGDLPEALGNMSELYNFNIERNKFNGKIPESFKDLTNLRYIYASNNKLNSLPNYKGSDLDNERLERLYVSNNKLDFGDIQDNVDVPNSIFSYSPQDSIGTAIDSIIYEHNSYTMIIETPGDSNTYQWYKDGSAIEGATESTYTISDFYKGDQGVYHVRVKNKVATDLTLIGRPHTLDLLKKPDINISVFQNPGNTAYADIIFISDLELEESSVEVIEPSSNSNVLTLESVSDYVQKASYQFDEEGAHSIHSSASGTNGLDSTQVIEFNVTIAKAGVRNLITTINNEASLEFTKTNLTKDIYMISEELILEKKKAYKFGPVIDVDKESTIEIRFDEKEFDEISKLFVYQKTGDTWTRLDSKVMQGDKIVRAEISELGIFKLEIDKDFTGNNIIPDKYELGQNYPNPFNPVTNIPVSIKKKTNVKIEIFNILGQKIKTLVNRQLDAGVYTFEWNGRNSRNIRVASGVYFYRIITPKFVKAKKMLLIK